MSDVARYRTALDPLHAAGVFASRSHIALHETRELGYITIRGALADQEVRAAYGRLGLEPPTALSFTGDDNCRLLWLSPNECLLICPLAQRDGWIERLRQALEGCFAAVVDTSGTFVCLELGGAAAPACLMKLCAYDLGPRNFPAGKVITTVIKGIPCHLVHLEEGRIAVLMRYSFAHFLYRLIAHAASAADAGPVDHPSSLRSPA